jgi:hypothetical protein
MKSRGQSNQGVATGARVGSAKDLLRIILLYLTGGHRSQEPARWGK